MCWQWRCCGASVDDTNAPLARESLFNTRHHTHDEEQHNEEHKWNDVPVLGVGLWRVGSVEGKKVGKARLTPSTNSLSLAQVGDLQVMALHWGSIDNNMCVCV